MTYPFTFSIINASILFQLCLQDLPIPMDGASAPADGDKAVKLSLSAHFHRDGSVHIVLSEKAKGVADDVTIAAVEE